MCDFYMSAPFAREHVFAFLEALNEAGERPDFSTDYATGGVIPKPEV